MAVYQTDFCPDGFRGSSLICPARQSGLHQLTFERSRAGSHLDAEKSFSPPGRYRRSGEAARRADYGVTFRSDNFGFSALTPVGRYFSSAALLASASLSCFGAPFLISVAAISLSRSLTGPTSTPLRSTRAWPLTTACT